MEVKIRFNTAFPKDSDKKWRLLIDGVETLVDAIEIKCKSWTTEDEIEISSKNAKANKEIKYHITCKPNSIKFRRVKNEKKVILS